MTSLKDIEDYNLRVGKPIEVLYVVEGQGSQWWPAHVVQVNVVLKDTCSLSVQVKYTSMFGFRSSTQVLFLLGPDTMRDKHGTQYPWRVPAPEQVQSVQDSTDSKDLSFHPDEVSRKRKKGPISEDCNVPVDGAYVADTKSTDVIAIRREFNALKLRVQQLESQDSPQRSLVSASTLTCLSYLGNRISVALERFPSLPPKTQHARQVFQYFSQNFMRKSADCTLSEMDVIIETITNKFQDGVVCIPSREDSLRSVPSELVLEFNDFNTFIQVFGNPSHEDIQQSVWKWKPDRSTGSTFGIRMIGSSVYNDSSEQLPSMLLPACSLSVDQSAEVFIRPNNSWNTIEGVFSFQLEKKNLPSDDLNNTLSDIKLDKMDTDNVLSSSKFKLKWSPESPLLPKMLLLNNVNRCEVLGTLTAIIPYVLLRGSSTCEEMINLLDLVKTRI